MVYTPEEKLKIVLKAISGTISVPDLCRKCDLRPAKVYPFKKLLNSAPEFIESYQPKDRCVYCKVQRINGWGCSEKPGDQKTLMMLTEGGQIWDPSFMISTKQWLTQLLIGIVVCTTFIIINIIMKQVGVEDRLFRRLLSKIQKCHIYHRNSLSSWQARRYWFGVRICN